MFLLAKRLHKSAEYVYKPAEQFYRAADCRLTVDSHRTTVQSCGMLIQSHGMTTGLQNDCTKPCSAYIEPQNNFNINLKYCQNISKTEIIKWNKFYALILMEHFFPCFRTFYKFFFFKYIFSNIVHIFVHFWREAGRRVCISYLQKNGW